MTIAKNSIMHCLVFDFSLLESVQRLKIQKSSDFFEININFFMVLYFLLLYSRKMNFSSYWNIKFWFWKCVQVRIASCFFLSFLWFFNTIRPRVFLSDYVQGRHIAPPCKNADSKRRLTWNLAQSHFVVLQKIGRKKFSKHFCRHRDDYITNYVNLFEKLCEKWLKYVFCKINVVAARKKISKIFLQIFKVKKTCKLNIYIVLLIFLKNSLKWC